MKLLKEILLKISPKNAISNTEMPISGIYQDSRQVQKNSLFVATRGTQTDGHDYISKAIQLGATAIICEDLPADFIEYSTEHSSENPSKNQHITYIHVQDSAEALGIAAANFYDNPSERLKLVAVTGTNGKTTSVTLLFNLFRELGYSTGLLSTIQNQINEEVIFATHTTPDAPQLNALLAKMVVAGCTHCFMEASSHAIVQRRIAGITFAGAVFTNITHDHLDFHKTFDEYIKAKKRLFDDLPKTAFALTNADDKRGAVMLQNTKAQKYSFGLYNMADFKAKLMDNTLQGMQLEINQKQVWCRLIGRFNAYNLIGALGVAMLLGEEEENVLEVLSRLLPAQGRFEQVFLSGNSEKNNAPTAIVDYAHTPDALQNVLQTIKDLREDNQLIITVVGCGGNRDKTKRPEMAKIACQMSNVVILTSDNPRNEDPMQILADMQENLSPIDKKKVIVIENRKDAIQHATKIATKHDIILVAGKGHETYQEINGIKYDFDDRKVLKNAMSEL